MLNGMQTKGDNENEIVWSSRRNFTTGTTNIWRNFSFVLLVDIKIIMPYGNFAERPQGKIITTFARVALIMLTGKTVTHVSVTAIPINISQMMSSAHTPYWNSRAWRRLRSASTLGITEQLALEIIRSFVTWLWLNWRFMSEDWKPVWEFVPFQSCLCSYFHYVIILRFTFVDELI